MKSLNVIVRDKLDPSRQIQMILKNDLGDVPEIGVVYNNGMELLIISEALVKDIPITMSEIKK